MTVAGVWVKMVQILFFLILILFNDGIPGGCMEHIFFQQRGV